MVLALVGTALVAAFCVVAVYIERGSDHARTAMSAVMFVIGFALLLVAIAAGGCATRSGLGDYTNPERRGGHVVIAVRIVEIEPVQTPRVGSFELLWIEATRLMESIGVRLDDDQAP